MYMVNIRLDIFYAVNQLSQSMVNPTKLYWKETKHALRYLIGSLEYRLWYKRAERVKIQGFTNVDWAGNPFDRKITSR